MGQAKVIAGLASALALAAAGPAAAQVLPIGTWSLNEGSGTVAHDSSLQSSHDGTLAGGAQWAQGRFRGGLSFDGSAATVDVPAPAAFEPAKVTVSAWVNSSSSPGNFKYIVAKGGAGCIAGSYALYTGANGGLEFYAASNSGLTYSVSPDAGTGVWDGRWHSVIGTFDGSTVRLYRDGRQVGSGTADPSPIAYGLSSSNDLTIGDYPACSGLGFSGRIDQVRVFDRALGAQEIGLGVGGSLMLPPSFPVDVVL